MLYITIYYIPLSHDHCDMHVAFRSVRYVQEPLPQHIQRPQPSMIGPQVLATISTVLHTYNALYSILHVSVQNYAN